MDRWQTYPVSFVGGLQTNLSSLQQGMSVPGTAQKLINFEPSIDGGYRRIKGYTKQDTQAVPGTGNIRGLFYFNDAAYVVRGTDIYFSGGAGWTELTDNSTYGSSGINLGSGTKTVRFVSLDFDGNRTLLILDPDGKALQYKGGVLSRLTGIPSDGSGAEYVEIFKNHVFLASGRNVVFSSPYSTSDFTPASGGGVINVGHDVTGLITFRDMLLVFTEKSILQITGSTIADFNVKPVTDNLGCVHPDTIQEIGGDVIFLAPDGLRLVSGTERNDDFGLAVVSRNIQQEMKLFIENHNSFCSVVIPTKSQYRVFGTSSTPNSEGRGIIGVQTAPQGGEGMMWAETLGIKANFAHATYSGREEVIVFSSGTDYVYKMESGNSFDSGDITATYITPHLPITDPSTRKTLYKMDVFTDPEGSFDLTVDTIIDYDIDSVVQPVQKEIASSTGSDEVELYGTAVYDTGVYSNAVINDLFKINLEGSGKMFAFKFTSQGILPPISLNAMSIQYAQNGRR